MKNSKFVEKRRYGDKNWQSGKKANTGHVESLQLLSLYCRIAVDTWISSSALPKSEIMFNRMENDFGIYLGKLHLAGEYTYVNTWLLGDVQSGYQMFCLLVFKSKIAYLSFIRILLLVIPSFHLFWPVGCYKLSVQGQSRRYTFIGNNGSLEAYFIISLWFWVNGGHMGLRK
jgi:hypothetical protein